MLWHSFIIKIFEHIARVNENCIYMLWGKNAQSFKEFIGKKSIILETSHPSGFSVNKGFMGCNHFIKANNILIEQDKKPINWQIKD